MGFLGVDLFEELNFLSLASLLVDEAFLSRSPSRLLNAPVIPSLVIGMMIKCSVVPPGIPTAALISPGGVKRRVLVGKDSS